MSKALLSIAEIKSLSNTELKHIIKRANKELRLRNRQEVANQPIKQAKGKRRRYKVYVLICQKQKYYVGITAQRVSARFEQHTSGKGAKWTKKYKPLGIIEQYEIGYMTESEATVYENEKTHELISEHGAENVRGGDLCFMEQSRIDNSIEASYKSLLKAQERAIKRRELQAKDYQEELAHELILKTS